MSIAYESVAVELGRRIMALIPDNPKLLLEDFDVWDLFKVPGFDCNDLGPSMYQAAWALAWARAEHMKANPSTFVIATSDICAQG